MKKNVRTIITMMTMMVSACIIFASCGKVEETHNQVVNTTEKAAATATAESKEEIITEETTTTTTTTTTTAASTTEEPETTAETNTEAIATEAVTTIAEPDTDTDTETAATTVETETDTGATTTETPADDGMYPMEECIRRVIKDNIGQEVVSFEESHEQLIVFYADTEDGEKVAIVGRPETKDVFESEELTDIDKYVWSEEPRHDANYGILYNPKR